MNEVCHVSPPLARRGWQGGWSSSGCSWCFRRIRSPRNALKGYWCWWMDGRTDGRMNEWMNEWINQSMNQWINQWMNQSVNQWINESIMNEWMDESIRTFSFSLVDALSSDCGTCSLIFLSFGRVPVIRVPVIELVLLLLLLLECQSLLGWPKTPGV